MRKKSRVRKKREGGEGGKNQWKEKRREMERGQEEERKEGEERGGKKRSMFEENCEKKTHLHLHRLPSITPSSRRRTGFHSRRSSGPCWPAWRTSGSRCGPRWWWAAAGREPPPPSPWSDWAPSGCASRPCGYADVRWRGSPAAGGELVTHVTPQVFIAVHNKNTKVNMENIYQCKYIT